MNIHESFNNFDKIAGEKASKINILPRVWRDIASGHASCASPDRTVLIQMMQLMHHKLTTGDVDLFEGNNDLERNRAFTAVMQPEVDAMLTYFGKDWDPESYPCYGCVEENLNKDDAEYEDRLSVVQIGRALFDEFGYWLPASFYMCYLAPVVREGVCDIVPLRFSEDDKANARAWDAWLHAGKVFPFLHTIQSISSEVGNKVWLHGCGCNHGLSRLGNTDAVFHYRMDQEAKEMWVRDAIWTAMYEYVFFLFTPVTRLMTGDVVEFE